mmetsp:Transcript_88501/g.247532  ORF Transcript_88501/g.247532 Transcript_88501/m.247532 type:complete len:191 (+) Transcript_88501:2-574(+)
MLEKMKKNRKSPSVTEDYRDKISKAMKAKWQDADYREKTLNGIAKHSKSLNRKPRSTPTQPRGSAKEVQVMKPLAPGEAVQKVKKVRKKKQKSVTAKKDGSVKAVTSKSAGNSKVPAKKRAKEPDGSVNRLREERRDLFDLLYGDEQFSADSGAGNRDLPGNDQLDRTSTRFDLGDEDLDSFDPYGLDDY